MPKKKKKYKRRKDNGSSSSVRQMVVFAESLGRWSQRIFCFSDL